MINYENKCNNTKVTTGNSVDINLNDDVLCHSAEIRSDIVVDEFSAKRIWGQVKNCNGQPVANSMVKLVKVVCNNYGQKEFLGIAHTITDCEGFYQFDICADDLSCYKIIVNKATTGLEAVMVNEGGNCNLCNGNCNDPFNGGYNPCCPPEVNYVNNPSKCNCNPHCGCAPCAPCPPMPPQNCDYKEPTWCENPYGNMKNGKNRCKCSSRTINNKSISR